MENTSKMLENTSSLPEIKNMLGSSIVEQRDFNQEMQEHNQWMKEHLIKIDEYNKDHNKRLEKILEKLVDK